MRAEDINLLSEYNNRVSKGIIHTPEYMKRMEKLQAEWDLMKKRERKLGRNSNDQQRE